MNFSTIKKFFSINRKKKTVDIEDELRRSLIKNLEIFRHVPNETVSRIDDVKSTLTTMLSLSVHDRSSMVYQLFDQKLKSLVEYFKQDVLVREYVNRVYSKEQQVHYNIALKELFQTCELLSSQLRNMLYFNDRNSRIAEMSIEIAQSSKQLKEKREKVCTNLDLAIKNRMIRKWSILKTSTNKQSLEAFLSEITGMKAVMMSRHQQVVSILEKVHRREREAKLHSGVADYNEDFNFSAIGSQRQRYTDLLQDDATAASKVINDADGWEMLAESSSRGTFQDAISAIV